MRLTTQELLDKDAEGLDQLMRAAQEVENYAKTWYEYKVSTAAYDVAKLQALETEFLQKIRTFKQAETEYKEFARINFTRLTSNENVLAIVPKTKNV